MLRDTLVQSLIFHPVSLSPHALSLALVKQQKSMLHAPNSQLLSDGMVAAFVLCCHLFVYLLAFLVYRGLRLSETN